MSNKYIRCQCGAEYLPAEIYYPNSFLGRPHNIHKTISGKIDWFDGQSCDTNEEFTCEYCGRKFNVHANLSFLVSYND